MKSELTYTPDIHSLAVRFLCQHLRSYIAYKSKAQEFTNTIYVGVYFIKILPTVHLELRPAV
jgi:hypothetical protein